jgi:hypothetical protein
LYWFANHGFAMQISYRYQSTDLEIDDWRMCSTHFTRDCFERDPLRMMEFGVDGTFKRRLKPDATPNVPLASPDPERKKMAKLQLFKTAQDTIWNF